MIFSFDFNFFSLIITGINNFHHPYLSRINQLPRFLIFIEKLNLKFFDWFMACFYYKLNYQFFFFNPSTFFHILYDKIHPYSIKTVFFHNLIHLIKLFKHRALQSYLQFFFFFFFRGFKKLFFQHQNNYFVHSEIH